MGMAKTLETSVRKGKKGPGGQAGCARAAGSRGQLGKQTHGFDHLRAVLTVMVESTQRDRV